MSAIVLVAEMLIVYDVLTARAAARVSWTDVPETSAVNGTAVPASSTNVIWPARVASSTGALKSMTGPWIMPSASSNVGSTPIASAAGSEPTTSIVAMPNWCGPIMPALTTELPSLSWTTSRSEISQSAVPDATYSVG